MSDVLIKGMEMPDKTTTIVIFPEGKARVFRQDIDHDEWLTAIEVQKHGKYIEREAAIDAAKLAHNRIGNPYENIREVFDSIPAADVRPVVRGRWVTRPYMMGQTEYCSRCGENYGRKHNFCPNCGCDMRQTKDGE